jgi:hypothetical protein
MGCFKIIYVAIKLKFITFYSNFKIPCKLRLLNQNSSAMYLIQNGAQEPGCLIFSQLSEKIVPFLKLNSTEKLYQHCFSVFMVGCISYIYICIWAGIFYKNSILPVS